MSIIVKSTRDLPDGKWGFTTPSGAEYLVYVDLEGVWDDNPDGPGYLQGHLKIVEYWRG